jgi:hypothetical protein
MLSESTVCLLSQLQRITDFLFLKNGMWVIMCVVTWHNCTWEGYVRPAPPPPNWVLHADTPFVLPGTDVERVRISSLVSKFKHFIMELAWGCLVSIQNFISIFKYEFQS